MRNDMSLVANVNFGLSHYYKLVIPVALSRLSFFDNDPHGLALRSSFNASFAALVKSPRLFSFFS